MDGKNLPGRTISFWGLPFLWLGSVFVSREQSWVNSLHPQETGLSGQDLVDYYDRKIPLEEPEKGEYLESLKKQFFALQFVTGLLQFLFLFLIPLIFGSGCVALLSIDFDYSELSQFGGAVLMFLMMFYAAVFVGLIPLAFLTKPLIKMIERRCPVRHLEKLKANAEEEAAGNLGE